jgi:hypothetical protein
MGQADQAVSRGFPAASSLYQYERPFYVISGVTRSEATDHGQITPWGNRFHLGSGRQSASGAVPIDFDGDVDQLVVNAQRLSDRVWLDGRARHQ